MDETEYRERIRLADEMIAAGDRLPYWFGFRRGTMRRRYGEEHSILSDESVSRWIHTYDSDVDAKCLAVQGYQEGFYGGSGMMQRPGENHAAGMLLNRPTDLVADRAGGY